MSDDATDLSSLTSQLPENVSQLEQLEALLADDPTNAELVALRDDLKQVIQMTLDLQKAAGIETNTTVPSSVLAASNSSLAPAPSSSSSLPVATSAVSAPSAVEAFSSAAPVSALPADGVFPPGSRVMAVYDRDGKYYVARIDKVDRDLDQYGITYLEYQQQAKVSFDQVKPWKSATMEQLTKTVNAPVKAIFPDDGVCYNASVEGPSSTLPGYFMIRFPNHLGGKKKKRVEVPLNDIIINEKFMNPVTLQLTSAASASATAASTNSLLSEDCPIPEYLEIRPDDSEAAKQQKMKKIKKLKYDHKRAFDEQESKKRASSWQDFKAGKSSSSSSQQPSKKQKLSHLPGLQQLNKPSMFSAPEGGVLGVVGSGRGVTQHSAAARHVFAQDSGSADK